MHCTAAPKFSKCATSLLSSFNRPHHRYPVFSFLIIPQHLPATIMSSHEDDNIDDVPIQSTTETNGTSPTVSSTTPKPLLEPSLKLDRTTIDNNLHKADQAFAREVVKLIAERAENGIFARDCWGYKFLDPPVTHPLLLTEFRLKRDLI
jgi:hypothetical protein